MSEFEPFQQNPVALAQTHPAVVYAHFKYSHFLMVVIKIGDIYQPIEMVSWNHDMTEREFLASIDSDIHDWMRGHQGLGLPHPEGGFWNPDLAAALIKASQSTGPKINASSMTRDEMEAFILSRTVVRSEG